MRQSTRSRGYKNKGGGVATRMMTTVAYLALLGLAVAMVFGGSATAERSSGWLKKGGGGGGGLRARGASDGGSCPAGKMSSFQGFNWSASEPYVASGTTINQIYLPETDELGEPYGFGESILVVDPESKVIYQTLTGGASWYFENGSYVALYEEDGSSNTCVWTPNGYDYERTQYLQAMQVASYNNLAGDCNKTIYTGMVLDALSCKERIGVSFLTDERNFVHSLTTIFPLKTKAAKCASRGKKEFTELVERSLFQYNEFRTNTADFNVLSLVGELPDSCSVANWQVVCPYYYPPHGKPFTW
jgi:hypothetical protein